MIVYRLGLFEKWEMAGLEQATFQSANALTTLGFVSGTLGKKMGLSVASVKREDGGREYSIAK